LNAHHAWIDSLGALDHFHLQQSVLWLRLLHHPQLVALGCPVHGVDFESGHGRVQSMVPRKRAHEQRAKSAPQGDAAALPSQGQSTAVWRPAHASHRPRGAWEVFAREDHLVTDFQASSNFVHAINNALRATYRIITISLQLYSAVLFYFFLPKAISRCLWLRAAQVASSNPWAQIPCTCCNLIFSNFVSQVII
jgi:hypothetical protein